MPIVFATKTVEISRGKGRKDVHSTVTFDSNVKDAAVALNGFQLSFADDEDHRLNVCEVFVEKNSVSGMTVNFTVHCDYSDKNHNDSYRGLVTAFIIADVA